MYKMPTEHYAALALQVRCDAVNVCKTRTEARQQMEATIARIHCQVRGSKKFIGPHLRLIVLPEYFLTGFPMGETISQWAEKSCLTMNDALYEKLADICRSEKVYLSGNVYELDDHFPGLYFQISFILDDQGKMILRYRRLISMFAATPHDVLDKYIEIYGEESLFPVVDTPLGRLAAVASEEILYPEITRALAMRGAEVICHSSSEITSPLLTPKNAAKIARAYENHLYVISANSAGITGIDIPEGSTNGGSKIVDFHGHVIAEASSGESMVANADIEIDSLRHYRQRPSMFNTLTRQRFELFRSTYAQSIYPANNMIGDGNIIVPQREHFIATQKSTIEKLKARGII